MNIRQLEWRGTNNCLAASALGIETFYRITGNPGNWELMKPALRDYVRLCGFETQIAAKNAAQVDFQMRIKAELST